MSLRRLGTNLILTLQLAGCASLLPAPPPQPTPSVVPEAPGPAVHLFIESALSMQGVPYRFGGESPLGFDCSGLVSYAAKKAGFQVPRTAREQLQSGKPVSRESIRPGDLVFMRLSDKLHVGIVTGDGNFVHAPSSGGRVRVDRLDAGPYRNGFVAARRIQP